MLSAVAVADGIAAQIKISGELDDKKMKFPGLNPIRLQVEHVIRKIFPEGRLPSSEVAPYASISLRRCATALLPAWSDFRRFNEKKHHQVEPKYASVTRFMGFAPQVCRA
ncbi:hypothetical protein [Deinococcus sp. LM3]|uniref:hypothetical protein n=1 Tax=Deinococcus sp. LM3 TaxID=1938608 RepID=UPI0011817506|nr:hypothetical protein [Deinococcus sp. LM3]